MKLTKNTNLKKIICGVIGLGVGSKHLETLVYNKSCIVKTICDFDTSKLKYFQNKFSIENITKNFEDITNDEEINFVCIASYDNFHFDQIAKCIKKNKNIFVEKPICLNLKEFYRLNKLINSKPKIKISSNFVLRTNPFFNNIKKQNLKIQYGNIYHIEGDYNYGRISKITKGWRGKIPFYSVTHGGAIHLLDLLLWITNDEVIKVTSIGNNISTKQSKFKYNDIVTSLIKFKSGKTAKITSNYSCVMPHNHYFKIFSDKKTIIYSLDNNIEYRSRKKEILPRKIHNTWNVKDKRKILNSFIDYITKNKKPIVTIEEVMKVMYVSLKIEQSLKLQKWIKL